MLQEPSSVQFVLQLRVQLGDAQTSGRLINFLHAWESNFSQAHHRG